ncbi:MAG: hypothetical protein Q9181_004690 [Wetmoreana brouardii]
MSSSFQELLSPSLEPDTKQASVAAADRQDSEAGPPLQAVTLPSFPRWPRVLGAAFNVFVLLGSISIIGILAHSLRNYSGTRGIHFQGLNISWPKNLNLRPAYVILAASAMSVGPSFAFTVIGLRRSKAPTYSRLERVLASITCVLLVMWVVGDILQGVSEKSPKTDILRWACRRRESPTNVLVSYTSICDEQVIRSSSVMDTGTQSPYLAAATVANQRHEQLVKVYGPVKTLHPAVKALHKSPAEYRMLQDTMDNHYKLLLGRSQDLADYEITVYDAAFMTLIQDAKTHMGAVAIFVEELLGMKPLSQPQKPEALKCAVRVRTLFLNLAIKENRSKPSASHSKPPVSGAFADNQDDEGKMHTMWANLPVRPGQWQSVSVRPIEPARPLLSDEEAERSRRPKIGGYTEQDFPPAASNENRPHGLDGNTDAESVTSNMDDPKLTKLLSVYCDAKRECNDTEPNTTLYFTSTRFLRDTAENCIQYISNIDPGDPRLDELRDTFEEASTAMEKNLNGQKRRFDYDWRSTPTGPVVPTPPSRREKKRKMRGRRAVKYTSEYER